MNLMNNLYKTPCVQNRQPFFSWKIFNYSSISIVIFKVIPLKGNTTVLARLLILEVFLIRTFSFALGLFQHCGLCFSHRRESWNFYEFFHFWDQEKVREYQVRWIRWLRRVTNLVFGQKAEFLVNFFP